MICFISGPVNVDVKYRNVLFRKMFVGGVDPLSRSEEKPHRSTRLMGSKPDT